MSYPSLTKPIRTLQWEGWREGIDDVRYLTRLLMVDPLRGRNGTEARSKHLRTRVGVDKASSPSLMREKIIEGILRQLK